MRCHHQHGPEFGTVSRLFTIPLLSEMLRRDGIVHPSARLGRLSTFVCILAVAASIAAEPHSRGMHADRFLDPPVLAYAFRHSPPYFTSPLVLSFLVLHSGSALECWRSEATQRWLYLQLHHNKCFDAQKHRYLPGLQSIEWDTLCVSKGKSPVRKVAFQDDDPTMEGSGNEQNLLFKSE